MIDIKKKVKKPSRAIQYMLDGLLKQSKRRNFKIEMMTFGSVDRINQNKVCFGCAATCAVQEISGKNLTPAMFRNCYYKDDWVTATSENLNFHRLQLRDFEFAINSFRIGQPEDILKFFDPEINGKVIYNEMWRSIYALNIDLQNDTWRDQIPKIKEAIKILKSYNL